MKVPAEPPLGHVIAYDFLWRRKAKHRENGDKTYPTALILSKSGFSNSTLVYALGISHMPPPQGARALEVPAKLCRWIGLDTRQQWIYTDELNLFVWPGPDLRPASRISKREGMEATCVLGTLPSDWFEEVKRHFHESYVQKRLGVTKRTE